MQKFFSVLAESQDGTTKLVPARGNTPGEAFQQIKQMPGVRRVGKVREISPADYEALLHGRQPPADSAAEARHHRHPAVAAAEPAPQPGRVDVHFALKGPRVVIHARPSGGEQPFKDLYVPPERLKPYKPAQAAPRPVTAPLRPEPVAQPEPHVAVPVEPAAPAALEYRVVKSRRAGGSPYLLQRGHWDRQNGKRAFKVEWEKGFDDRDKADAHAGWVQQSVEELAAVSDLAEG